MNVKERIVHALAFEALALAILVPVASMVSGAKSGELLLVAIGMSIFTVIWNYIFNVIYDKYSPNERSKRGLGERILHVCLFEGGLIFVTVPTISWFLKITIFEAFLLEMGFLVFFFFYAIAFNYGFDKARDALKARKKSA